MYNSNFKNAFALGVISFVFILIGIILSISLGSLDIATTDILNSFITYDSENSIHIIIRQSRVPRTFGAILIGSSLAVAGAIMQGVTRNPIADTGILGISAGSTFVLSIIMCFFPYASYVTIIIGSITGSAFSAIFVYILSESGQTNNTAKLAIAGATLTGLLTSLGQALAMSKDLSQNLAFWTFGSVSTITFKKLEILAPIVIVVIIIAIFMSKQVTIMSMGDEVAIGLGVNTTRIKVIVLILVVLLASISVALAGMISFVGLIVPHFVRRFAGIDYKYIIPLSALLGGVLVLYGDIISRSVVPNSEIPIGAVIAIIGVPTFLYIAKGNNGLKTRN